MIAKIDAKGITGPSVDDYFANLNTAIGSFFNDSDVYNFNSSLLKPINNIDSIASAEKVILNNYSYDDVIPAIAQPSEFIGKKVSYAGYSIVAADVLKELLKTAGESNYAMAA
jgi:uncharacterized membrane protein YcgQ (UPF0703/DUF1980 family)